MNNYKLVELIDSIDLSVKSEEGKIAIPIAVTNDKELINIEIKSTHGISLISGLPGSGKSTIIRIIISTLLKKKEKLNFEFYLADTTGCEFPEMSLVSSQVLKGTLESINKKSIEKFIDELYARFIEKQEMSIEKMPITFVFIDDIYVLLDNLESREYIIKLEKIMSLGLHCGFEFIILCQNYNYAYSKLPMLREKIVQTLFLSPYLKNGATDFSTCKFSEETFDNDSERFTVVINNNSKIKKGKLLYISLEEFKEILNLTC